VSGPRVVSLFEGNEAERTAELLADLAAGRRVTLISEAGTPSISDPGQRLVAAAAAAGVRVEVVPGPSAAIAALVGSGLPADRFLFVGFPPREEGARQELFGSLAHERATLIFFEAPARVGRTLADLGGALGAELLGLDPTFPLKFMFYFLIVVAVGGTTTITGPLVASLLLGIADVAGKYYVPKLGAFIIYCVMIAVLMARPQGLFARGSER